MEHLVVGAAIKFGLKYIGAVIFNGIIYFYDVGSAIARLHAGEIEPRQFGKELLLLTANFGGKMLISFAGCFISELLCAPIHGDFLGVNVVQFCTSFASKTFTNLLDITCKQVLEFERNKYASIILSGMLKEGTPLLSPTIHGFPLGLMRHYQCMNNVPNISCKRNSDKPGSRDYMPLVTTNRKSPSILQSRGRNNLPRSNSLVKSDDNCCCILQ